jgi:Ca2+-binding EF-hand superfamily protein
MEEAKKILYNTDTLYITLRLPLVTTQSIKQADMQKLVNTLYDKHSREDKLTWSSFFSMISQRLDKNRLDFKKGFESYDKGKKGYLTHEEFSNFCLQHSGESATLMNTLVSVLPEKELVRFEYKVNRN